MMMMIIVILVVGFVLGLLCHGVQLIDEEEEDSITH